jgi:hypothetical protein
VKLKSILSFAVFGLVLSGGVNAAGWEKSMAADGRRFIPVELWTGSDWDGTPAITLPVTDLTFGKRAHKRIVGPKKWAHTASGTVHDIYERHNRNKVQYFAINRKRDGLGRVYDSRYGRYCPDEVKFPLGWWKQGEKRIYDIVCDRRKRHIEVTITRLNFTFDGIPHSLEFHWKLDDGTKPGSNNHYTYSPGKGLVRVTSN